jgi:hypothetical protein
MNARLIEFHQRTIALLNFDDAILDRHGPTIAQRDPETIPFAARTANSPRGDNPKLDFTSLVRRSTARGPKTATARVQHVTKFTGLGVGVHARAKPV